MRDERPSTTGHRHTLPLEKLPPDKFEELCFSLLRREGFENVRHLGAAGQDGGVDLLAERDAERVAVQCKREASFGPKKAEAVVTELLADPLDPPATRLLLMVSSAVSCKAETAARDAAGGLPVEVWAITELDERASRHEDLLDQFFERGEQGRWVVRGEGRGIGVGGDVAGSPVASGDENVQVVGDLTQAGRDAMQAGRDFHQHFHGTSIPTPSRVPLTAPAPPPHFTGRAKTLDELTSLLLSGENVGLTALQGMGGIGKTAVAKKLAKRLRTKHSAAFPGGVLWSELGPSPDVLTVLDVWARHARADSDLSSILDPKTRAEAVRQLLATRGRFCAILDDVWDAEPARLLFEALPPDCPRLLTTRVANVARGLGCKPHRLDKLGTQEGLDLIARHLGGELGEFEAEARRVLRLTEALPLAIEIAIGLIDEPGELSELADDLARRPRLEVLARGKVREESLEVCFALSYDRLDAANQRRFRALGAFADTPFDAAAVVAVWGEDEVDSAKLRYFSRRNLLQRDPTTGALRLHGLLQDYARSLLEQEGETKTARDRHAEHYRGLAASAPWQTIEAAYEQVRQGWMHVQDDPEASVGYALSCVGFQKIRGHWQDRERWLGVALAHTQPEGDSSQVGEVLRQLAWLQADLGKKTAALENYEAALQLDRRIEDRRAEGRTLHSIAWVYDALGRKDEALRRYEEALEVTREVGDRRGEGTTLSNIALVYDALGRKEEALGRYEEALEVTREVGDRGGEGTTLNNIAVVYSALGRQDEALRRFEEALEVRREVGDRGGEGTTLNNIAAMYDALGRQDEALRRYEEALEVRREVGDRGGEGTTLNNIAGVYSALGRKDEALRRYEEALEVTREVGDRGGEGTTLNNIAWVYSALGRKDEALRRYEEALEVLREVGDRWFEAMGLANYAKALHSVGRLREAVESFEACVALDEALGHPHLERDRALLEQVRRELAEAEGSSESP